MPSDLLWTLPVGSLPLGLATLPDGSALYVANGGQQANSLSVIDLRNPAAPVDTIHVGKAPWGVAASPDGHRIYATNSGSDSLSIVDTAAGKELQAVPVGPNPQGVAVSFDGSTVYVANSGSGSATGSVSVVDVRTDPAVERSRITVMMAPAGLAITPTGLLWVAETGSDHLSVIDTSASPPAVVHTVPVGAEPFSVAAVDDGSAVYVSNRGDGTVSVLNTASDPPTERLRIAVGPRPAHIALAPGAGRLYVAVSGSNDVITVGTRQNVVIDTVSVGQNPAGVAVVPDGTAVVVTESGAGTASAIATGDTAIGIHAAALALSPDGKRLYAIGDDSLLVLDVTTRPPTVGQKLAIAGSPSGIAVTPNGIQVLVTRSQHNAVSVIDVSGAPVLGQEVQVGLNPQGIAVSPDGRQAVVANLGADSVSILDLQAVPPVVTATVDAAVSAGIGITADGRRAYTGAQMLDMTVNPPVAYDIGSAPARRGTAVVVAPDGRRVFESGAATVTVVDDTAQPLPTLFHDVIRTDGTVYGLAVTTDGSRLLATQRPMNATTVGSPASGVWVVDLTRDRTTDSAGTDPRLFLPVGSFPAAVVAGPAGEAYVANSDVESLSVVAPPLPVLPTGNGPVRCALSPDRTRLFVADGGSGTLSVIGRFDRACGTPWSLPIGGGVSAIAALPDDRVLLTSTATNTLHLLHLQAGSPYEPPLPLDGPPTDIAVTADSRAAYVACPQSGHVWVIDLTSARPQVIGKITLSAPSGVTVTAGRLWVTSHDQGTVTAIDISTQPTGSATTPLAVGGSPGRPRVSPDGRAVYLPDDTAGTVTVVSNDAVPTVVIAAAGVGDRPVAVGVSPASTVLYVVHQASDDGVGGTLAQYDVTAFRRLRIDQLGLTPTDVTVDPVDGTVFVPNGRSGTVSVLAPTATGS